MAYSYYYYYYPVLPPVKPPPPTKYHEDSSDEEWKEQVRSDPKNLRGDFIPPAMAAVEKKFKDQEFIDLITQIVGKPKDKVQKFLKKETHIVAWTDTGEIDPGFRGIDTIMNCAKELKTETLDLRCFVANPGSDSMYMKMFPYLYVLSKLKKVILGRELTPVESNELRKQHVPYSFGERIDPCRVKRTPEAACAV